MALPLAVFGKVIFNIKKVKGAVDDRVAANLDRASLMIVNDVVQSFGSPSVKPKGAKTVKGKTISDKQWRQSQHSIPGDPPFVQTGMLRRSITFDRPSKLIRRVGSTLKPQGGGHSYAYWLERGHGGMAARPYLRPAVLRNKKKIMDMVKGAV